VEPLYIDTPLVRIAESPRWEHIYVIYVPEPRYFKKYYEKLIEPVTKIVYECQEVDLHWLIKWSGETDKIPQWLKNFFLPRFLDLFEDLFRKDRDFRIGWIGEIFDVEDISVKTKHEVKPDPDRKDWFYVTVGVKVTLTLNAVRPVPKYEASWVSEKLTYIGEHRLPFLLHTAVEQILKQEGREFEWLPYKADPKYNITLIVGNERESYEKLIYWAFVLHYDEQSVDIKTLNQLIRSVESDLKRKPSEGLSRLTFILSMLPPSTVTILSGTFDSKTEKEIGAGKLSQDRGEGLNFVLGTLSELREVLGEVGL